MRTKLWTGCILLVAATVAGCSGSSDLTDVVPAAATTSQLVVTEPASKTATATEVETDPETEEFVPPFPDNVDLFAPPKVVVPVVTQEPEEEEPEPVEEDAAPQVEKRRPPPLRLLGFVNVEGLKAMLQVNGKLNVVTIGDEISGVEVVAVEAPSVMLRHQDHEFELNLFEQPWFHQADATAPQLGAADTFGGQVVQPAADELGGFGGAFPPLPGMDDDEEFQLPALPEAGVPGPDNEGTALPALPGLDGAGALDLPTLPGGDQNGLPGLPDLDGDNEGPAAGDDEEATPGITLPGLPGLSGDDLGAN